MHIDQTLRGDAAADRAVRPPRAPKRCELEGMPQLAMETARRLACDSALVVENFLFEDRPISSVEDHRISPVEDHPVS